MEQKHALGTYISDFELPLTLTLYQWGLIENILTLLAPFEELTKEISSSLRLQQIVVPSIVALKRILRKVLKRIMVFILSDPLLEAVEKRFGDIELEPLNCLATILDLR